MNNSIQEKICEISKKLIQEGLNHAATGNISVRLDDHFYITPSGTVSEHLKPIDIVKCPLVLDEELIKTMSQKPSSEWHFHKRIYEKRIDVKAVIHTHSVFASTLSVLRRSIPAFHYMIALFGGKEVKCGDYKLFGSKELSDEVVLSLGNLNACLMANHGLIVGAKNLKIATKLTEEVENISKQYLQILKSGKKPVILSKKEMVKNIRKIKDYNYGKI